ncbi:hypothetical protein [Pedobacter nanyangensis]|uniref:hypothetical protein n=1 Tax=Pedobacter nanyangensis TaxID=1562389 RepID=UPI000DE3831A|nr:hypothetical protein [Pedobacter nanyangensis]
MNFLKRSTTWTNLEFMPFKLCIASIYIIIGSYFNQFFKTYYVPLFILFGLTLVWTLGLWLKKMKS